MSSMTRSYLVTFPSDLGDVDRMFGYGVGVLASVRITELVQGGLQVSWIFSKCHRFLVYPKCPQQQKRYLRSLIVLEVSKW